MQMTDNAGASDEHRALNYLTVRYPAIYAAVAQAQGPNCSLTAIDVRPSALSGVRNIVEVIFSFTDRATGVVEKQFLRVDVTEEFPFSRHQTLAILRPLSLRYLSSREDKSMMMPGFSAETSLYRSSLAYYQFAVTVDSGPQMVQPAQDSCTCTSPNCTWQCPLPDPCAGLRGCALARCECRQDESCRVVSDPHPPCFFRCVCIE